MAPFRVRVTGKGAEKAAAFRCPRPTVWRVTNLNGVVGKGVLPSPTEEK